MTELTAHGFAYTDGDVDTNNSVNPSLNAMIERRYSRRSALRSGAAAASAAVFGGAVLAGCDSANADGDFFPVIVSVGSSDATSSGRVVTLTGNATDAGTITSSWTQTAGPTVTLTGAGTATASFIAPAVSSATTLTFEYRATDNAGQASVGTTSVVISPATLGFASIAKNLNDVVTVPAGYSVTVLTRLGDPITSGAPSYKNDGTDTDFASRIGDHGDALGWYGLSAAGAREDTSSTRGLIVQNHENLNVQYLHPNGPTSPGGIRPEAEAIKEIEAHGVSVTEVVEGANRAWTYVQNSTFNRRITPNTPMILNGPVRGATMLRTPFSTDATAARGTINNCANGHSGWGTNLTCEENWAGYFRRNGDDALRTPREVTGLRRYGVTSSTGSYGWSTVSASDPTDTRFRRWDARATAGGTATTDWRNEPNQFGWVVEIDPYDKSKAPRKRTALGRLGHEGAWLGNLTSGKKVAVYLGDDSRGEYFYKFVSNAAWNPADAQAADRLAIGDKYLDAGTLHVAKFNADGTGVWVPLVFGSVPNRPAQGADAEYVFADQADILVHPRLAGDAVGATRMDRPEWTATNPVTGDIYLTLTNNNASTRPLNGTDAANPRHYNDPKGASNQFGNPNGHILRLRENGGDPAATGFVWDIYLFGADSADANSDVNISGLTASNDFSSPDGLWFSRPTNAAGQVKPLLWIQTDDGAFTDRTNNQMLAALPGTVGDGGTVTITNVGSGGATATQTTRRGTPATDATLKRFLVGPVGCEITGVDTTPDGRALFVGIQHPGENGTAAAPESNWPTTQATGTAPAGTRPRSAVIVITKNDGGVVGL
ncbi:alkaline phosphatase PhoX [Sphingomonas sp. ST-64]|uniref:Alkaline phosphatase PhoX n=1 Tax=Sphingomonas plantiphila TaxID=3163295 RepID=A0ABW8YTU8_9SPHN